MRVLPDSIRKILQEPMGELLSEKQVLARLSEPHGRLVSVGDTITYVLLANGVKPDIFFYDLMNLRRPVSPGVRAVLESHAKNAFSVENPAGVITEDLEKIVSKALKKKKASVFVKGEEDLAALVVFSQADPGTVVVYGQPEKGVVYCVVNKELADKAQLLINSMDLK